MINIDHIFVDELYFDQVEASNELTCPGIVTKYDEALAGSEIQNKLSEYSIDLPQSLIDFYQQVAELSLTWELTDDSLILENEWLEKNYLNKGYSKEALKILLSGQLHIAEIEDILDLDKVKATGMFDAATKVGLKAGDLRPIDFNEFAVACMKVEDGVLLDNVYLYTGFGGLSVELYDMKINFEKYLELAYKAKCFNYWNLIYCLKDKVPNYELLRRYFPAIFPHLKPELEDFGIYFDK